MHASMCMMWMRVGTCMHALNFVRRAAFAFTSVRPSIRACVREAECTQQPLGKTPCALLRARGLVNRFHVFTHPFSPLD
jgi:hypothetical protein